MSKLSNNQLRHNARRLALQAIYQWQFNQEPADQVLRQFLDTADLSAVDVDYFTHLINTVIRHADEYDAHMKPFLDRAIASLNPVELAILRLAICEFANNPEVPYRVVINEALEIGKEFGAEQGHKYINAILDAVAAKLRPIEVKEK